MATHQPTPSKTQHRRQATSAETDALRARALRGDRLNELTDSRREWIWRSLLKGTRLEIARELAGLTDEQTTAALALVRRWYQQRLADYKRQPRSRTPVTRAISAMPTPPTPATPPTPLRRGWWPFGSLAR